MIIQCKVGDLPKPGMVLGWLLLAWSLFAGSAMGQGDTFPAAPFNGLQITYTVAGATINSTRDEESFTVTRKITGSLGTGKLSVTGSVKGTKPSCNTWAGSFYTKIAVTVWAGDQKNTFVAPEVDKCESADETYSFNVSVAIPEGTKSGGFTIDETYVNPRFGNRGVVVSGDFSGGGQGPATQPETRPTQRPKPLQAKPLCPEAKLRFPLITGGSTTSNILMNNHELATDFDRAINEYNGAHQDTPVHTTDNIGGTIPALLWLFAEGGTTTTGDVYLPGLGDVHVPGLGPASEYSAKSFVFQPEGEADKARLKGYTIKQGTEPALAEAMKKLSLQKTRKLTPGDVLKLALEQRQGDIRQALLLAHNTLRSLGRHGDAGKTGVETDPSFFTKHLTTIRMGGDNAGPWYHLFGTAYFGIQSRADHAMVPLTIIPNTASDKGLDLWRNITKALGVTDMDPRRLRQASDVTSLIANEMEQLGREWMGGSASDPEKYCFNIWGAQIAAWLYREKVPPSGVDWKASLKPFVDFAETAKNATCDSISSFMDKLKSNDSVMDPMQRELFGLRGYIQGSPVNSVWESNGQRLILDQRTSDLRGFVPALITPFLEPDTGTWGMLSLVPKDQPFEIKMEAVADGPVHLIAIDFATEKAAMYVVKAKEGERFHSTFTAQTAAPTLERDNGGPVGPHIISLDSGSHEPAPPHPPRPVDQASLQPPPNVAGTYNSEWGIVTITHSEGKIDGYWMVDGARRGEIISGSVEGTTLTLRYRWGSESGTAVFTWTATDLPRWEGNFRHDSGLLGAWNLTLIGPPAR